MWLVVLAAVPFTAPFAALDVADLWGSAHPSHAHATVSAPEGYSPQPEDAGDDVAMADASSQRVLPTARSLLAPVTPSGKIRIVLSGVAPGVAAESTPPARIGSALSVTLRL